ncbi:MAG: phage major capsid protein [Longimicrobiales bacterium]
MAPSAEQLVRREAARRAGQPLISVAGEPARPYSLARAVLGRGDGFEAEVGAELLAASKDLRGFAHHGGMLLPPEILGSLRGDTQSQGGELVFTGSGGFRRAYRPRPVLGIAGARIFTIRDSIRLVWLDAGLEVVWQPAEIVAPAIDEDPPSFASDAPEPSFGMVALSWSRRLAAQANPAIDAIIEADVDAAVATVIDHGAISGSGSSGEPEGLLARGLPSIDATGGLTYALLVEAEQTIGAQNADSMLAWITSTGGRAALRSTPVLAANEAGAVWRDGRVLDHPAFASNVVTPEANIILGAFENVTIGVHAVELLVDQVSAARRGLVRAVVYLLASVAVSHPDAAFVVLENVPIPAVNS